MPQDQSHWNIQQRTKVNNNTRYGAFINQKESTFFLFVHENICCGYSLEASHRAAYKRTMHTNIFLSELLLMSIHNMFSWRNWNNIFWLKKHLIWSYGTVLFVLRFYGPVNPIRSCRARSVYLTTCLLGRLSPLSG